MITNPAGSFLHLPAGKASPALSPQKRGSGGGEEAGGRPQGLGPPWGKSLGGEASSLRSEPGAPSPLPSHQPQPRLALPRNSSGEGWGRGGCEGEGRAGDAPLPAALSDHPDPQVRALPAWQTAPSSSPFTSPSDYRLFPNSNLAANPSPSGLGSNAGVGRARVRRLAGMSPGGLDWKLSFPFWSPLRPCVKTLILLVKKRSTSHAGKSTLPSGQTCAFSLSVDLGLEGRNQAPVLWHLTRNWPL